MFVKGNIILSMAIVLLAMILILVTLSEHQAAANTTSLINKDHSNTNNGQMSNKDLSVKNGSTVNGNIDNSYFISVFDGKTLKGWKMAGDGRFTILEGGALQSEKGGGLLWYTKKKYDNFELKLEWKVSDEGDNSGVFVRFPDPEDDPGIAVKEGYEVQIDDKAGDAIHQTGAIYDFAAPSKIVSKPPGQWNTMEVQVVNQSYTVIINEEEVTKFTGNRLEEGYIGLQAHDDESKISFRNIMVKEVKSS